MDPPVHQDSGGVGDPCLGGIYSGASLGLINLLALVALLTLFSSFLFTFILAPDGHADVLPVVKYGLAHPISSHGAKAPPVPATSIAVISAIASCTVALLAGVTFFVTRNTRRLEKKQRKLTYWRESTRVQTDIVDEVKITLDKAVRHAGLALSDIHDLGETRELAKIDGVRPLILPASAFARKDLHETYRAQLKSLKKNVDATLKTIKRLLENLEFVNPGTWNISTVSATLITREIQNNIRRIESDKGIIWNEANAGIIQSYKDVSDLKEKLTIRQAPSNSS